MYNFPIDCTVDATKSKNQRGLLGCNDKYEKVRLMSANFSVLYFKPELQNCTRHIANSGTPL